MRIFIERGLVGDLDPRWNCHDGDDLDIDDIWHLHYTNMATQPWRPNWYTGESMEHPRKDLVKLFWDTLEEAKQAGYTLRERATAQNKFVYNFIGK